MCFQVAVTCRLDGNYAHKQLLGNTGSCTSRVHRQEQFEMNIGLVQKFSSAQIRLDAAASHQLANHLD